MKTTLELTPFELTKFVAVANIDTFKRLAGKREVTETVTKYLKTQRGRKFRKLVNKPSATISDLMRFK